MCRKSGPAKRASSSCRLRMCLHQQVCLLRQVCLRTPHWKRQTFPARKLSLPVRLVGHGPSHSGAAHCHAQWRPPSKSWHAAQRSHVRLCAQLRTDAKREPVYSLSTVSFWHWAASVTRAPMDSIGDHCWTCATYSCWGIRLTRNLQKV